MALNVFISHSFKDMKLLDRLNSALSTMDVEPYVAEADPRYGESLPEKIEHAIDSAHAVIVILTKEASISASVNQEIGYAKKAKKLIIAIVEEDANVGVMLQGLEVIRFTLERIDEAIGKLSSFVKKLSEKYDHDKPSGDGGQEKGIKDKVWIIVGVITAILAILVLFALLLRKRK